MVRFYPVGRMDLARWPASHYHFAQNRTPEKEGESERSADYDSRRRPRREATHFYIFWLPLGITASWTLQKNAY
jgi:hypothetical protein